MKYLLALIFLALPAYLIRLSIFGIPTTVLEILIYVVFVIGLFNLKKAREIQKHYLWPIGLLMLAAIISVFVSPEKTVALGQFKALFLDPLLILYLILAFIKIEDFSLIFSGLIGSGLIVSGYSIAQKLLGQVTVDNRVVGIFGYSPNYPALFLGPIAGMMIAYSLQRIAHGSQQTANSIDSNDSRQPLAVSCQPFATICLLLAILAIYFSGSRGAFLAVFGGIIFYLIIRFWSIIWSKLWLKIALVILIGLSIILAWSAFKPNFNLSPSAGSRVTSSDNIRWQIWQTSWEMGRNHPIFGIGLGNYQNDFNELTKNRVNFPEFITPLALSAHNIFFMFWLTTGITGLVAFVWLLVIFYQIGSMNRNKSIALVLMTGMTVLILQGLVDTPYFKNDLSLLFWFLFAFMLLLNKGKNKIEEINE